jgi:nitrate reductase gamma subunit
MYDFIRGPMVWVALALFFGGLIFQGFQFFRLTKKTSRRTLPATRSGTGPKKKTKQKRKQPLIQTWIQFFTVRYEKGLRLYRRSIAHTHPIMTLVTILFHGLLFIIPIFLLAHLLLIEKSLGLSGLSTLGFSESFSHTLNLLFIMSILFFLLRRIFVQRVRVISTAYDYLVLLVTALPFVTGYLAHEQCLNYQTIITVHIIAGELMLIVVPFTKLGHMLYFFLYRFFLNHEYSFGQGTRKW